MKKIILLLLVGFCGSYSICAAQFGKSGEQSELFVFGRTTLFVSNDFIKEENKFKHNQSSLSPALFIHAFQADSGDVWHGSFSFSSSVQDNSETAKKIYQLNSLQARVMQGKNVVRDWNDIMAYPFVKDTAIYQNGVKGNFKTLYELVNYRLAVNDSITLEIRQKTTTERLIAIHIKRAAITFQPSLAYLVHDSSVTLTTDDFIQRELANWASKNPPYYEDSRDTGIAIANAKYSAFSKLAFYFRRPMNYPDSSLEYKLTGGEYDDKNWHPSGHLILVPRLWANAHYELTVRYKNSTNLSRYTFYVPPAWYQKHLYFIIYVPAFLIIFFATIIMARYRVKKAEARKERLAAELKSIRSQLNPHFVFNALSSIQALINKNEVDLANQYLTEFSNLLRDTLQNHNSEMVPLAVDLKILENYIRLEQLRFNFYYEIKTGDYIQTNTIEIPALLLQPLVENAVKHGIAQLKEAGRLLITFSRQHNDLIITITDNGKGFDTTIIQPDRHGLRLTKERIALLNKTLKEQSAEMEIRSDSGGTIVTVIFKNWLQA